MSRGALLTVERLSRIALPVATTFLASLFSVVSLPMSGYVSVAPSLTLMAIYCWTVWRPHSLPYGAVFLIGMLEDLLRGLPLGLTPLLLLILQAVLRAQQGHIAGRTFDVFWIAFALAAALHALLQWLAAVALSGGYVGPEPGIFQLMFSVAVFPLAAWLLLKVGRALRVAI